ncbi:hypothetical protein TRFO_03822 [Tritrichomonas foetus]|uniref:Uncharacterized protein n=1 Tax=Tritrichomonas foetus TaxID=1144522 RepID=A0A1J4KQB6_9EUKA|nr:hypothetical protein TRFO_03822 [Tritrichomonas foetus]|eukprot:OHT11629.1 hypothetical protein TRFO_03822 [Tritrichomonas foetus]
MLNAKALVLQIMRRKREEYKETTKNNQSFDNNDDSFEYFVHKYSISTEFQKEYIPWNIHFNAQRRKMFVPYQKKLKSRLKWEEDKKSLAIEEEEDKKSLAIEEEEDKKSLAREGKEDKKSFAREEEEDKKSLVREEEGKKSLVREEEGKEDKKSFAREEEKEESESSTLDSSFPSTLNSTFFPTDVLHPYSDDYDNDVSASYDSSTNIIDKTSNLSETSSNIPDEIDQRQTLSKIVLAKTYLKNKLQKEYETEYKMKVLESIRKKNQINLIDKIRKERVRYNEEKALREKDSLKRKYQEKLIEERQRKIDQIQRVFDNKKLEYKNEIEKQIHEFNKNTQIKQKDLENEIIQLNENLHKANVTLETDFITQEIASDSEICELKEIIDTSIDENNYLSDKLKNLHTIINEIIQFRSNVQNLDLIFTNTTDSFHQCQEVGQKIISFIANVSAYLNYVYQSLPQDVQHDIPFSFISRHELEEILRKSNNDSQIAQIISGLLTFVTSILPKLSE